jgi:hypothetical protein
MIEVDDVLVNIQNEHEESKISEILVVFKQGGVYQVRFNDKPRTEILEMAGILLTEVATAIREGDDETTKS